MEWGYGSENEQNTLAAIQRGGEMLKTLKEAAINLLKVKSIVTVILTLVFAYLSITGVISGEQFLTIFSVVIAFYFGTQYQKGQQNEETEEKTML